MGERGEVRQKSYSWSNRIESQSKDKKLERQNLALGSGTFSGVCIYSSVENTREGTGFFSKTEEKER